MDEPRGGDAAAFENLVALIARLRAPGGCPWDREQTHRSLKPMTLEEAYEVLEAIDDGDDPHLASELGDLLLQVVFHSQIAAEESRFTIADVIRAVSDKMVRRHPHVFGDQSAATSGEVLRNWEAIKRAEQAESGQREAASMLDSVSSRIPAVMEAFQIATKVSRVGFDWPDAASVLDKVEEEVGEVRAAVAKGDTRGASAEVGDLLFAVVSLARLLGEDPESALKAANRKFRRRFGYVEDRLRERGRSPAESSLQEMESFWAEAKQRETE
jgi:tetrapyrrole methylase family protein / MazG family protein